jgi:hypothetical protein
MPYCPSCKCEYVEGITRCPDCDTDLVDKLPEEHRVSEPVIDEELVCVLSTPNPVTADIVKDMLEAAGITVMYQPGMTYYGQVVDSAMDIHLYVFKSRAEEAEKLIEESDEIEG